MVHAVHLGHRPGEPPPLERGAPVPGCSCPACTGVTADDPIRSCFRAELKEAGRLPVEEAQRVGLLDVAGRLGLSEPVRRGREYVTRCPLHDDEHPSLRMDANKSLWYCDPCAVGGDAIRLVELALNVSFDRAVRWLVGKEVRPAVGA